jgi:tRNA pseudouridine38/39 synthase
MDPVNCSNFVRKIESIEIHLDTSSTHHDATGEKLIYYVEIVGTAFLWHQVRAMMSILFLVGDGREETTIVQKLLDLDQTPRYLSHLYTFVCIS